MSETASTSTNGVHTNGHAAPSSSKHEEMQYLDMIRDIMSRGQVRVRRAAQRAARNILM